MKKTVFLLMLLCLSFGFIAQVSSAEETNSTETCMKQINSTQIVKNDNYKIYLYDDNTYKYFTPDYDQYIASGVWKIENGKFYHCADYGFTTNGTYEGNYSMRNGVFIWVEMYGERLYR